MGLRVQGLGCETRIWCLRFRVELLSHTMTTFYFSYDIESKIGHPQNIHLGVQGGGFRATSGDLGEAFSMMLVYAQLRIIRQNGFTKVMGQGIQGRICKLSLSRLWGAAAQNGLFS